MIDYEEELKKFEPCLDVADAEGAIYERELTDILDILQEVLREAKSGRRVKAMTVYLMEMVTVSVISF